MTVYGSETLPVRCYEVGISGVATPTSFADYFQEAASNNARDLGFPGERLWAEGVAWVLTRLSITVDRYPAAGETITVRTWPSTHDRNVAMRCYEIFDTADNLLASGTSAWAVMDVATRKIAPIPDFVGEEYPKDQPACQPFATRAVPKLREAAHTAPVLTRKADLDMNGHVNNARYSDWVMEAVPDDFLATHEPSLVDITFRAECGAGTRLTSSCSDPAAGESLHSVTLEDGTELCRARVVWRDRTEVHLSGIHAAFVPGAR
jgi:acyl-ACP thioesterase